jgi:ribosome biogenesis GTPase A
MTFWAVVKNIVSKADIVIEVVDARMPELSRNHDLEKMVKNAHKHLVIAFNKADIISPQHSLFIRKKYKGSFFVSGTRNLGMGKLRTALMIIAKRDGIENPKIGVVGYPNVGKSAIINALAHRAKAIVSATAGTTRGVQIIRAGSLHVLDSPGVFPYGDDEVKLGILAAKNPEQLKNPEMLACEIIKMFLESNRNALEDFYKIKLDEEEGWDSYEIMLSIGQARNMILKGGVTDEHRTAMQIIRDWQTGKLRI